VVSYAWYLKAMIWPAGLAVFYPHPGALPPAAEMVASGFVLASLCAVVIARRRAFPALAMGWCWWAGTLLPVAGIVQVGAQARADRYAYVPLVGIFVIVVWSAVRLTEARPAFWRRALAVIGVAWIAALSIATRAELPHWHDSAALFQRAVDVVPDNAMAHNNLGMALVEQNKLEEARGHFEQAVAIAPGDTDARSNLGNALRALGRPAKAVAAYEGALDQSADDASVHYNLATALVDLERVDEAEAHLHEAIRLNPAYTKARILLGAIAYKGGRIDDALAQFREVARLDPHDERVQQWIRALEK
jgi:Flp pilus assembly protein TadD